jgi:hypothetical protein
MVILLTSGREIKANDSCLFAMTIRSWIFNCKPERDEFLKWKNAFKIWIGKPEQKRQFG